MTVKELIKELELYEGDKEVRIVDREAGWDDPIYFIVEDTYGIDPETQVAICIN